MDLDTLEAIAAEPGPELEAAPELLDAHDPAIAQAEQLFGMVFGLLSVASPKVREHYPPSQIRAIAEAWVPVAQKRGWDMGGWMASYGPEIALVFAIMPPQVLHAAIGKMIDWATGAQPEKEAAEPAAEAVPA